MFGLLWGYREPGSNEAIPTNIMGSLGSLGIEWGYKIRPVIEKEDTKEQERVAQEEQEQLARKAEEDKMREAREKVVQKMAEDEREEIPPGLSQFVIDEETAVLLKFRETLIVATREENIEMGYFSFNVDSMGKEGKDFLVHLSGRALVDGVECGTTITSSVDRCMNSIDEKRFEFEYTDTSVNEKHLYIAHDINNQDGHYVHIASVQKIGGFEDRRSQDVPFDTVKNLITEGASMLLMRFMAVSGFTGIVELTSVLNNTAVYPSTFTSNGPFMRKVNGKVMKVYNIQRTLLDMSGKEQFVRSMFNSSGRLLEQVWLNGPYSMYISPLTKVRKRTPIYSQDIEIPLHLHWEDCMHATSVFLDHKTHQFASHNSYFIDHPEIKQMIADFVQALLLVKPKHPLQFAMNHFKAFDPSGS